MGEDRLRPRDEDFTVGWICALPVENAAAEKILDKIFDDRYLRGEYLYTLGQIGHHNVAIVALPSGVVGTTSAAVVASQLKTNFPSIQTVLMVGIGGGVPSSTNDVRLGDVVISQPQGTHGGVVEYNHGKAHAEGRFEPTGHLARPPKLLLNVIAHLRKQDQLGRNTLVEHLDVFNGLCGFNRDDAGPDVLFEAEAMHSAGETCINCSKAMIKDRPKRQQAGPVRHYGTIASGSMVMKDAILRDKLSAAFGGVLCFEMEAAGLMNDFPCLVIRGISDYSDSHKNDAWQPYAAATAAACAKEILSILPPAEKPNNGRFGPKPFSVIPYPPDKSFVGRKNILEQLELAYKSGWSSEHVRTGLVGLGGYGKTQIAIQFAHWAKAQTPDLSVFWIHASNVSRFEQGFKQIAKVAQISGLDDPQTDILELVSTWLSDDSNGQWLMVLDNVDDDSVFWTVDPTTGREQPLHTFLPFAQHGSILITSRNFAAAEGLVDDFGEIIQLEPMSDQESLDLLRTKISLDGVEEDARELIQALERIPLAIAHAAAYIKMQKRLRQFTIARYLELFRESDASSVSLLNMGNTRSLRQDYSNQLPVISTWQVTINQIQRDSPSATKLLALMSTFERQGTPGYLLYDGRSKVELNEDLTQLLGFSLIREQVNYANVYSLFEMHGLVQLSTKKWLEAQNESAKWLCKALEIMAEVFPGSIDSYLQSVRITSDECQKLIPHSTKLLRVACEELPGFDSPDGNDEMIQTKLAYAELARNSYSHYKGENKKAWGEQLLRNALRIQEKHLGPVHPFTITTVDVLGIELAESGKFLEAEGYAKKSLEAKMRDLGPNHYDTILSLCYMGILKLRQGSNDEAERLLLHAVGLSTKVLSPEHYCRLLALDNLSTVYLEQGRLQEALDLTVEVNGIHQRVYGFDHHSTLDSFSQICSIYRMQGRLEEAEMLAFPLMGMLKKVFGPDHRIVESHMNNLARIYLDQRQLKKAEHYERRLLKLRRKRLGSDHPHTLLGESRLAEIYIDQDRLEEAEQITEHVFERRKLVLGPSDSNTLASMNTLALVWKTLGRTVEAIELVKECRRLGMEALGSDHDQTKFALEFLEQWQEDLDGSDSKVS